MPIEIETCERMADHWHDDKGQERPKYHAQIKGEPGIWACGRTIDEAVGDLIRCHPSRFGVKFSFHGKQHR